MLETLRTVSLFQELTEQQLQCLPQGISVGVAESKYE